MEGFGKQRCPNGIILGNSVPQNAKAQIARIARSSLARSNRAFFFCFTRKKLEEMKQSDISELFLYGHFTSKPASFAISRMEALDTFFPL